MAERARPYTIPAGTRGQQCRGAHCTSTLYMVEPGRTKPDGKPVRIPVDADQPGGQHPTATRDGIGYNHFLACPDANSFSRSGRR